MEGKCIQTFLEPCKQHLFTQKQLNANCKYVSTIEKYLTRDLVWAILLKHYYILLCPTV